MKTARERRFRNRCDVEARCPLRAASLMSCLIAILAACGSHVYGEDEEVEPRPMDSAEISLASVSSCRIDSDCADGTFCLGTRCAVECSSDEDCRDGARCSERARCVRPLPASLEDIGDRDERTDIAVADSMEYAGSNEVVEWPDLRIPVPRGAPFVEVRLRTAKEVPEGSILYTVTFPAEAEHVLARRAEGSSEFQLVIPTGAAGADEPDSQYFDLGTPMGSRPFVLVPERPVGALYAGHFSPTAFGGAPLPVTFQIRTEPYDAVSLDAAKQAWLLLPRDARYLISFPEPGYDAAWVEAPLKRDEGLGAWVATFSRNLDARTLLGDGFGRPIARSVRVEIEEIDDGELRGAMADRWRGFFDRFSAEGIRESGVVGIAGRFEAHRTAAFQEAEAVDPDALGEVHIPPFPAPSLSTCEDAFFSFPRTEPKDPDEGEDLDPCEEISGVCDFRQASSRRRATCALAKAAHVLEGNTIETDLRAFLDADLPNPDGLSFTEYLQECASDASPRCRPSAELLCARELVSHAYLDVGADVDLLSRLSASYDSLSREAFVGRQLAAFHVDMQTRLEWLRGSEAPEFLAPVLKEYNEAILRKWRQDVLSAHVDGVLGQMDEAGMAVLARSPSDPEGMATRNQILIDLSSSWRAAMDALTVLAQRLNVLYQEDHRREDAAAEIRRLSFTLYVFAAVLNELSLETGSGSFGSLYGRGFADLNRERIALDLPFSQLVFSRDATVVVSQSVNPEMDQRSLLQDREGAARRAVSSAQEGVDRVLDEAHQREVDELSLRAEFEDQIVSLRNELIELCGLPLGCEASDVGFDPACAPPTEAGECGFVVERGQAGDGAVLPDASVAVSEAGRVLLSIKEAHRGVEEREAALMALIDEADLLQETMYAFADKVHEWDRRRRDVNVEVAGLLEEIGDLRDSLIQAELSTQRQSEQIRRGAYETQATAMERWNTIRIEGVEQDIDNLHAMAAHERGAAILKLLAERVDKLSDVIRDGMPTTVGMSNDPSWAGRLLHRKKAYGLSTVMLGAAYGLEWAERDKEIELEEQKALREAELDELKDMAELDALQSKTRIASLEAAFRKMELESERSINNIKALIDALERNLELDLAHERDLMELRDRRDQWLLKVSETPRLEYELVQADLTVEQRTLAYFEVVQQAELLERRLLSLQGRFGDINALIGSPDLLFAFSSRLDRAESRVSRARRALDDWLVALEYYAVRPFVAERLAIMLARNPAQLEAIADEILRLQRVCGGPVTREYMELSIRDDILGLRYANLQENGAVVSPEEQLKEVLQTAAVPDNRRVPVVAGARVGDFIDRGDTLAMSFELDVEQWGNLPLTCNAKLENVSVALDFEQEIEGTALPVVNVVYGTRGTLRSCQPGINEYVRQFGRGATSFASVTSFRTAGRTVSPIAGVGSHGDDAYWNVTLEGMPLAARYSILIDLRHASNQDIPWDRLADVRLRFGYTYQDVFPTGQCE